MFHDNKFRILDMLEILDHTFLVIENTHASLAQSDVDDTFDF